MAGSPISGALRPALLGVLCAITAQLLVAADKPPKLSLQDVTARSGPAFTPVHLGEKVRITGVVNDTAYHFPPYTVIAIEDRTGAAVLSVPVEDTRLDTFQAGEEIEAAGTVESVAGMIVVHPDVLTVLARKMPPLAINLSLPAAEDPRYLGRRVHVRGTLGQVADTVAGTQLFLDHGFKIFIPRQQDQTPPNFATYASGDSIDVTGVEFLYTTSKPYNRGFELLAHPEALSHQDRSWSVPPIAIPITAALVLLITLFLWTRERRMKAQRERLRKTYQLGEAILSSGSSVEIVKHISDALPRILGVSRVHLFVHNRGGRTLDEILVDPGDPVSIPLSAPPAGTRAGAAACYHYRTLLVIPDIDRSPFPIAGKDGEHTPHSLLFVPMMAQGEVIGVLELDQNDRPRDFNSDEQTLAQHLGNQIAVAIRLLDQRNVQEQLFRTEKLAAVGRLISGVVNELQSPLSSISGLARRALEKSAAGDNERELGAIAAEAQKAAGMVTRLVSFAAAEQVEARPVSVGALLKNLIEFREGDWKASGIRVRDLISTEPLFVLGAQGQLEQVFLNLLVHAEQSLAEAPHKSITVRTSVLAKRLLVEIAFSAPRVSAKPEETAGVLGVTRSVIAGHGGEVRLIEKPDAEPRFEVELPVTTAKERMSTATPAAPVTAGGTLATAAAHGGEGRRMTGLVIEPDEATQRRLTGLLSARGYRVVPVVNADAALELVHRMRFDAAFCSVHAPGLNWVELSERMHPRVGGFILLSDGYDAELAADFESTARFVLPKPVQEPELDRVLRALERAASPKVIPFAKDGVA
ncbi:MAG TPA: GAF domain-containing protein [Candidatus Limnocylindrales bacterium]|nr:GAF domain-containing protein [Candidatus Limnocylindrales bacterium]